MSPFTIKPNNFEKLESSSMDGILSLMNNIDLKEYEILGHPQSYVEDNKIYSYGSSGALQEFKPKNIFYIFLKKKVKIEKEIL